MNKTNRGIHPEESGLTLVELLASIVILSIIVVSILSIFILTMKTNKSSEKIIDATYIAQVEMEKMYEISQQNNPTIPAEYRSQGTEDGWDLYEKQLQEDHYVIQLKLKDDEDRMKRVLIKVFEGSDEKAKAQMESLYQWGEGK